MNTVQDVFDIAIRLMDAQNEGTGSTDTADTREYRLRTPSLLNSILDRAYPASDTWPGTNYGVPARAQRQRVAWGEEEQGSGASSARQGGASGADFATTKRPVCQKVAEMTDEIGLDGRICTGVLPYGLAALLLTEENPTLANFFWQTFLEQLAEARRGLPGAAEGVEDVYGSAGDLLEYGRFSRW